MGSVRKPQQDTLPTHQNGRDKTQSWFHQTLAGRWRKWATPAAWVGGKCHGCAEKILAGSSEIKTPALAVCEVSLFFTWTGEAFRRGSVASGKGLCAVGAGLPVGHHLYTQAHPHAEWADLRLQSAAYRVSRE